MGARGLALHIHLMYCLRNVHCKLKIIKVHGVMQICSYVFIHYPWILHGLIWKYSTPRTSFTTRLEFWLRQVLGRGFVTSIHHDRDFILFKDPWSEESLRAPDSKYVFQNSTSCSIYYEWEGLRALTFGVFHILKSLPRSHYINFYHCIKFCESHQFYLLCPSSIHFIIWVYHYFCKNCTCK